MTIAWFTSNKEVSESGLQMTAGGIPFTIEFPGEDEGYWIDQYHTLSDQTGIWLVDDDKNMDNGSDTTEEELGLEPGDSGTLEFRISPNRTDTITVDICFTMRGIVKQRSQDSDSSASSSQQLTEISDTELMGFVASHIMLFTGIDSNGKYTGLIQNSSDLKRYLRNKTYSVNDSKEDDLPKVAETSTEFNSFENNIGRFNTNSGRNIYYYGEEFGDSIKSINGNEFSNIKTLNDLFAILLKSWKSWKRETAYPSCKRDPQYNLDNDPTYGQCAITAIIVYDLFGGTIHRIRVNGGGTHYFNKINGHYIDLTRDQFDLYNIPVSYEPNETMNREYCGKNPDTAKRLEILLSNMKENN